MTKTRQCPWKDKLIRTAEDSSSFQFDERVRRLYEKQRDKNLGIFKLFQQGFSDHDLTDLGIYVIMNKKRDLEYDFSRDIYLDSDCRTLKLRRLQTRFVGGFPMNISMGVVETGRDGKKKYKETGKIKVER